MVFFSFSFFFNLNFVLPAAHARVQQHLHPGFNYQTIITDWLRSAVQMLGDKAHGKSIYCSTSHSVHVQDRHGIICWDQETSLNPINPIINSLSLPERTPEHRDP